MTCSNSLTDIFIHNIMAIMFLLLLSWTLLIIYCKLLCSRKLINRVGWVLACPSASSPSVTYIVITTGRAEVLEAGPLAGWG